MNVELICPFCHFSKNVPREKIPAHAKWATCPKCGQRFKVFLKERAIDANKKGTGMAPESQGAELEPEKEVRRTGAPWENRNELGFWQGIFKTLKAVLFSPEKLFKQLTCKDGIKEPLAFALLVGSIGRMFGFFWQFLLLSGTLLSTGKFFFGQSSAGFIFLIVMVFIPVFVIISLFIYSGIFHVLLRIVGAGKNGFEATFRVLSYAQAAQVWVLIPFVGTWIGGIWQLVVQIIGLREIHETSYLRVIIAFLIPVAFIFLVVMAVVFLLLIFMNRQLIG